MRPITFFERVMFALLHTTAWICSLAMPRPWRLDMMLFGFGNVGKFELTTGMVLLPLVVCLIVQPAVHRLGKFGAIRFSVVRSASAGVMAITAIFISLIALALVESVFDALSDGSISQALLIPVVLAIASVIGLFQILIPALPFGALAGLVYTLGARAIYNHVNTLNMAVDRNRE